MDDVEVEVTGLDGVEVQVVSIGSVEVQVQGLDGVEVETTSLDGVEVQVAYTQGLEVEIVGMQGIPGPPGENGPVELYDSDTPPVDPPDVYLRFERDLDGDVQHIYLGTVT